MEDTVKQRITKFIRYKCISVREFERQCSLSNGYIKGIEQTIMPNKLKSITLQYPDLNPGWVITGEGEMLRNFEPEITKEPDPEYQSKGNLIETLNDRINFQEEVIRNQNEMIKELISKLK